MSWEYLNEDLDYRLWPVIQYLKYKSDNNVVVDLNCLRARLADYINCKQYIGNDLLDVSDRSFNCEFTKQSDDLFVKTLTCCDILVVLGFADVPGADAKESKTLRTSITHVLETHKPKIVIFECIKDYFNELTQFISATMLDSEYKLAHIFLAYTPSPNKSLEPPDDWLRYRDVIILERI